MNFLSPFDAALPSRLVYGPGEVEKLGSLVAPLGSRALVVVGGGSVRRSGVLEQVLGLLDEAPGLAGAGGTVPIVLQVRPQDVDEVVSAMGLGRLDLVRVPRSAEADGDAARPVEAG